MLTGICFPWMTTRLGFDDVTVTKNGSKKQVGPLFLINVVQSAFWIWIRIVLKTSCCRMEALFRGFVPFKHLALVCSFGVEVQCRISFGPRGRLPKMSKGPRFAPKWSEWNPICKKNSYAVLPLRKMLTPLPLSEINVYKMAGTVSIRFMTAMRVSTETTWHGLLLFITTDFSIAFEAWRNMAATCSGIMMSKIMGMPSLSFVHLWIPLIMATSLQFANKNDNSCHVWGIKLAQSQQD